MTEDEMVGRHHWFNGHGFEQTLGNDEGQGSLACCSPWGRKEQDMTERLNNEQTMCLTPSSLSCSPLDLYCITQDLSLGFPDSLLVAHGLQRVQAQQWQPSMQLACGILALGPGIKPASPALQGGFLTIEPLGKYLHLGLKNKTKLQTGQSKTKLPVSELSTIVFEKSADSCELSHNSHMKIA